MNDQQLEDLKDFIDGRISQLETRYDNRVDGLESRIDGLDGRIGKLEIKLEELRKEMIDGFTGVGEAIDEINKHFDKRISKLEQQAA